MHHFLSSKCFLKETSIGILSWLFAISIIYFKFTLNYFKLSTSATHSSVTWNNERKFAQFFHSLRTWSRCYLAIKFVHCNWQVFAKHREDGLNFQSHSYYIIGKLLGYHQNASYHLRRPVASKIVIQDPFISITPRIIHTIELSSNVIILLFFFICPILSVQPVNLVFVFLWFRMIVLPIYCILRMNRRPVSWGSDQVL